MRLRSAHGEGALREVSGNHMSVAEFTKPAGTARSHHRGRRRPTVTAHYALTQILSPFPQNAVPDNPEWIAMLWIANQHFLGPALHPALKQPLGSCSVPADVWRYLRHLAVLNDRRNNLLKQQCVEMTAAFNRLGVVPMFLKSTADLMSERGRLGTDGIVGDIDVLVRPAEVGRALSALTSIGYRFDDDSEPSRHGVGDLRRSDCAAMVDLHTGILNRDDLLRAAEMWTDAAYVESRDVRFFLPSIENQIRHRALHDHIQQNCWAFGKMHLSGAWRTAWLIRYYEHSLDWDRIERRFAQSGVKRVFDAMLLETAMFGWTPAISAPWQALLRHKVRRWRLALGCPRGLD